MLQFKKKMEARREDMAQCVGTLLTHNTQPGRPSPSFTGNKATEPTVASNLPVNTLLHYTRRCRAAPREVLTTHYKDFLVQKVTKHCIAASAEWFSDSAELTNPWAIC